MQTILKYIYIFNNAYLESSKKIILIKYYKNNFDIYKKVPFYKVIIII